MRVNEVEYTWFPTGVKILVPFDEDNVPVTVLGMQLLRDYSGNPNFQVSGNRIRSLAKCLQERGAV